LVESSLNTFIELLFLHWYNGVLLSFEGFQPNNNCHHSDSHEGFKPLLAEFEGNQPKFVLKATSLLI